MNKKGKNFSANQKKEKRNKNDFYQTPYSITRHLLERESFEGNILEPASGEGAIVKILKENYDNDLILESDINKGIDFLSEDYIYTNVDNIITNPPFSLAKEFILKSKEITKKKIAMLLPLNYLHGIERYEKIWKDKDFRLSKVYVFCRYPMLSEKIRDDGKYKTGMLVYAWYIWDKDYLRENPSIHWINNNQDILSKSK